MNALDQINQMFHHAEMKLKQPSIRLRTSSGRKLLVYPDRYPSRPVDPSNPTSPVGLQIRQSNQIVGLVNFTDRTFTPRKDLPVEARQTILDFLADPIRSAQSYAELTGDCCFCGRFLTDPRSVTVGYGPVCADRFALPWGTSPSTLPLPEDLSELFAPTTATTGDLK